MGALDFDSAMQSLSQEFDCDPVAQSGPKPDPEQIAAAQNVQYGKVYHRHSTDLTSEMADQYQTLKHQETQHVIKENHKPEKEEMAKENAKGTENAKPAPAPVPAAAPKPESAVKSPEVRASSVPLQHQESQHVTKDTTPVKNDVKPQPSPEVVLSHETAPDTPAFCDGCMIA